MTVLEQGMFPNGNNLVMVGYMERKYIDTVDRLAVVIQTARRERGWTQQILAEHAGVGRRLIIDLEAGHPRAEIGKVLRVLKVLGIEPLAVPTIGVARGA